MSDVEVVAIVDQGEEQLLTVKAPSGLHESSVGLAMVTNVMNAVQSIAELDPHFLYDIADKLTCIEAEAFGDLALALWGKDVLDGFMESHADGDVDCDDTHHRCCGPDCQSETAGS